METVAVFDVASSRRDPAPRINLVRRDTSAALTLPAACLLDQYRFPSGDVLLVLDEDVPYEEQMHLVLVRGTSVLDHLTLRAPYATGAYRKIAAEGASLRFSFAGPEVLTATVLDQGTRISPRLPAGAHRRGRWLGKCYLVLTLGDRS